MIKGNKGEWSEFYVFVKLLDERKLFAADENLEINKDVYYPVLGIFREESGIGKRVYDIESSPGLVKISDSDGLELAIVDSANLKKKVNEIFDEISSIKTKKRVFSLESAAAAMKTFHCESIKTISSKKADILLKIKDGERTVPKVGYSIKSMIGSAATLLNSSGATNFIYEIEGLEDKFVEDVNDCSVFKEKIEIIKKNGGKMKFKKVSSEIFTENLQLSDNTFPMILAELLLNYFEGKGNKFEKLLENIDQENIIPGFNVTMTNHRHKIKNFLVNVALGMVPNTRWDAYMKADGGYIIVKRNGDVCCYQTYDRDKFQDYLYKNTKFDMPDPNRHSWGKIYNEGGRKYFNLNLQIRFTK
ncbi:MAG: HpaII family restriction endonuclease [Candidatus Moranbacteria bacterium]|nr:HpaII family restriction endonuclease [Candidatus Moranbacteria bacterium]